MQTLKAIKKWPNSLSVYIIGFLQFQYNKILINIQENQWTKMNLQVKVQDFSKQGKFMKKPKFESSQSDQFQLQYHQIKKLGLPVNKKKLRVGNWTPEQNLIYLKFLQEYRNDFINEQQRRKNKVFFRLSKILKKRTPDQCRSHHQKLQMKYEDDIQEIIKNIKRKLQKKSSLILNDQHKLIDIFNKKTQATDIIQNDKKEPKILQQNSFYKLEIKGEAELQLLIFADNLKAWL